jgi:hypothetical protein
MNPPNIDRVIHNEVINTVIDLAIFVLADETLAGVLQWDGENKQCRLISKHENLQVQFEGQIYTPYLQSTIKNPKPGSYISLLKNQACYFSDTQELSAQENYQLIVNASSLRLDDLSINVLDYVGGVKLNLHANYAGDIDGLGKVTILSSTDVQDW